MSEMTYKDAREYLQPVADSTPLAGYGAALSKAIEALEAADAQAHCKDCRHYFANRYGLHNYCTLAGYTVPPHGFYYYGG